MKMIAGVIQGSDAWHTHRANHFNASDCPAMLGISPYKTRSQLLTDLATGISPEANSATKRRFADGHKFEELARPVAEQIIGEDLYPVVGTEGRLSASFDGLTMDGSICFEHKTHNASLRGITSASELPEHYRAQMEQQLMVSGAGKCLFMASTLGANDDEIESMHVWYESDQAMRDRIVQGWVQFSIDLESYIPPVEIIERPVADVIVELPALFIHARGEITANNMQAYGEALQAKLEEVRSIALITDADFSNAKEAAKMFREQCKKLELTKEAMLSQTVSIGEAARMMDAWHEDLRITALELEKKVEREDLAKKRVMVGEAGIALSAHVEALEAETRPIQLNVQRPDFATAIKGKRNYASMQDALDTELANGKIAADAAAKDIRWKLAFYNGIEGNRPSDYDFLFRDLQVIVCKPFDDFKLIVLTRIDQHKAAEAAKLEADRARIQAQEEAKAKVKEEAFRVGQKAEQRTQPTPELSAGPGTIFNARFGDVIATKRFRPTRMEMIMSVANSWDVHKSEAEIWLRDEFQSTERAA